jgi:predicted dehydrogenase
LTTPSIALCGAGRIAGVHGTAALQSGVTVRAIASRDPRHAIALTETLGGQAVLYDELPAGADLVVVCTPPAQHVEHALHALSSGVDVLVETPLCSTLADADRLVAHVGQHRVVYAENLLHAPVIEAFLTESRAIGPLDHLEARALQGPADAAEGALFELGSRAIGLALATAHAAAAGDPVSVSCEMRGGATTDNDQHAEMQLRFASGLVARVVASWQAGPSPLWDVQVSSRDAVVRAEVLPAASLERNGMPMSIPTSDSGLIVDLGYHAQLSRALADDTCPDASFGRDVLEVVCAASESVRRGSADVVLPYAGRRDLTPRQILRGDTSE